MSLDAILAEFIQLDSTLTTARSSFAAACVQSEADLAFDLQELIAAGAADLIHSNLCQNPTEFGRQLTALASATPELVLHLTHLRMVSRWMRATWGPSTPFATLYHTIFGHSFSLDQLLDDVSTLLAASTLDVHSTEDLGDECMLQCHEVESILAFGEVVLASLAPCYYSSDAALNITVSGPVFAITAFDGSRHLASATLRNVVLQSTLGTTVWQNMRALLHRAHTAQLAQRADVSVTAGRLADSSTTDMLGDWIRNMDAMVTLDQSFALSIEPTNQVSFDPASRRLIHTNLEVLWTDTAAATSG
jgi:hypothetical protein